MPVVEERSKVEPTEREQIEYFKCAGNGFAHYKYFLTHYCFTMHVDAPVGEDKVQLIPDDKSTDAVIEFYMLQENGMLRKSRQQMASWKFMACELHDVLFNPPDTFAFLNMSILEKLVDDGTFQSLMGKAMFIYNRLPDFLKRDLEPTHLKLENKISHNFIVGVATTEHSGRSGAYTGGLIDEGQDIPFFRLVFASISFAIKNKLKIIFTPAEDDKDEIELMWADVTNGYTKAIMHWSLSKPREWYEERCKGLTQDEIDRELDLKSGSGRKARVWLSFDYEQNTRKDLFRKNLPIELSADFGRSDLTAFDFYQINMSEIYIFDEIRVNMGTPHDYIIPLCKKFNKYGAVRTESLKYWDVRGTSPESEQERNKYLIMLKEDLKKIRAVGDPAGKNKEQTSSTSVIAQYAYYGLIIDTKEQTDYQYGLDQVDLRFKQFKLFLDRDNCAQGITEVQKWCYPTKKDGTKKEGEKPLHDQYSHGCAAKRYMCENNPLPVAGNIIRTKDDFRVKKPAGFAFNSRLRG